MTRPSFFIVGAPKAGTSSMAHYLGQHPELFTPDRKDVPFFGSDLDYRPGRPDLDAYLAQFEEAESGQRAGDACVCYLQSRTAATEIASFSPEARILIMLRDPVGAIPSLHRHLLYVRGEEIEDLGQALAVEGERADGRMIPSGARLVDALQYRDVFTYTEQVARYLDAFESKRIKIILYDDLLEDLTGVVRDTYRFLSVAQDFTPQFPVKNAAKKLRFKWLQSVAMNPPPKILKAFNAVTPTALHGRLVPALKKLNTKAASREQVDCELERSLRLETEDDVASLAELIDRDLSGWASTGSVDLEQLRENVA